MSPRTKQSSDDAEADAREGEPEPEQHDPFDDGEWIDATQEGAIAPKLGLPVWYSVDAADPTPVRLGTYDGEQYNELTTGRASLLTEVSGYKELYSVAPGHPGFAFPPPPEPEAE